MKALRWFWYFGAFLLAVCVVPLGLWVLHSLPRDPVTIHWNTTLQTIDGFGASATGYVGNFSPEQADRFFNIESGLGLSLLRLAIVPDTVAQDCGCVSNNPHYKCVAGSQSQILTGDLQVARLAASNGVRLLAAPWSPPAEMKTSGKFCGAGAMKGGADIYRQYASHLADFPALLKANGLSIDNLSVQNEPDVENSGYDTCSWTGQQIHDFIPYLSEALISSGFKEIKIAAPEEAEWTFDRLDATMKDPAVSQLVGLVQGHAYRTEKPSGLPETHGRPVWQTEVSDYGKFDGSMDDGLRWARYIHNYMTIGTNAWLFWSLDCGEQFYNKANDMCLTDHESHLAKRAFVLGQYAKFVRPGWQRIGVANRGSLLVTAYKGPDNKFAIVSVNNGEWPVRKQTFELKGITSRHSQISPWVTSASVSLHKEAALAVNSEGTAFVYTVPAASVVTFEGRAD
jgi:glucuronoarabinoxylan endo-1,4-beta-xylanase